MNDAAPIVFVVDDDPSVREALTNLLNSVQLGVRAFASAKEFLASQRPDVPCCLVLDVRLPEVSGLDLQHELRQTGESIPIVFITGYADVPTSVRAMKAGAVEFLPKPFTEAEMLAAIREAIERAASERKERNSQALIRRRSALLTLRERQVMAALLVGMLNKQVAAHLGISEITVKIHRRRIMEKMEASSLVGLAQMAEKLRGDASPDDKKTS
jgi:FixJ family two-component response regulator